MFCLETERTFLKFYGQSCADDRHLQWDPNNLVDLSSLAGGQFDASDLDSKMVI